jgi:hypothetical protein
MKYQYKPPEDIMGLVNETKKKIFVAGSIEMGKAVDWQQIAVATLISKGYIVLNPRRDNWDSSLEQSIDNPQFKEQVEWELLGLAMADIIVMFFDKDTKSPISLLELGLYARTGKLRVVCEEGFWRKGNVDIVCKNFYIPTFNSLDELFKTL